MECISVFDMLKIGIGPSSSHTLGPWRAAERWISELKALGKFDSVQQIKVHIYGSLSLTGIGHATDYAIMLGLSGADPVEIPVEDIHRIVAQIQETKTLNFGNERPLTFDPKTQLLFHQKFLPFHPNGLKFEATLHDGSKKSKTYYSIGGGFVVVEERKNAKKKIEAFNAFPFPIQKGTELLAYCAQEQKEVSAVVLENELSLRTDSEIDAQIKQIWEYHVSVYAPRLSY